MRKQKKHYFRIDCGFYIKCGDFEHKVSYNTYYLYLQKIWDTFQTPAYITRDYSPLVDRTYLHVPYHLLSQRWKNLINRKELDFLPF